MKSSKIADKTWHKTNTPNLYLHKSGRYYYRFTVGGKQIWESLKTKLKSVADARAAERQGISRKYRNITRGAIAGSLTIGQALDAALLEVDASPDIQPNTKRFRHAGARALLASWPELASMDARRLSSADVKAWSNGVRNITTGHVPYKAKTAMRNSKGCSVSKHNGMLDVLRMALDYALQHGAAFANVARDPSVNRPGQKPKKLTLPNRADFPKLVSAMREIGGNATHAADLVELLAYTGARQNEARNLLWSDVDIERNQIRLRVTKNGEPRTIPIIMELQELLSSMKSKQPLSAPEDKVLQVFEAQKSLDHAAEKAGIRRMTHHDFRHLFATTCIEAGIDVPTVARLLGHKDGGALAMKTYGHLRDEHAQNMMQRVSYRADSALVGAV